MLASMSQIDPRADTPLVDWSELGVSELPTGTVTLLLADVEGSTRLWQTQPEQMTAAVAPLDRTLADVVSAYGGVRPVEQGEGDSFVIAFARASDAVACALALQRSPLAPIRLRIGIHTGEVQLRDEANYIGPTINRTARLRDLAHGGQTVLSGAAEDMVVDRLPDGVWLTDLGSHQLRDLPRPERVVQLCHPDLRNEFPPLRTANVVAAQGLPIQLTTFVGREQQMSEHACPEYDRRKDAPPSADIQGHARARDRHAHAAVYVRLRAPIPLAQRQVGDLMTLTRQALGEVGVPALGAADGVREQAVVDDAHAHCWLGDCQTATLRRCLRTPTPSRRCVAPCAPCQSSARPLPSRWQEIGVQRRSLSLHSEDEG